MNPAARQDPWARPLPEREALATRSVGGDTFPSPLRGHEFVTDDHGILLSADTRNLERYITAGVTPPAFEEAGPRATLAFDPTSIACGIVTCGGLCPGLNDVVRSVSMTLVRRYGVPSVLGFRYGYRGIADPVAYPPIELTVDRVSTIHTQGGTILGSSRGGQDAGQMVDNLVERGVAVLFCIGGDGTLKGASAIAAEAQRRGLRLAVVGIPKTIDNDLDWVERSFGFATAVEEGTRAIRAAHAEARGADNGIGIVRLMGRESGFIAAHATLAEPDVNLCLVPEVRFTLEGEGGLLDVMERRLRDRRHAVVVVAEGAGQELVPARGTDASGNKKLGDIGVFLRDALGSGLRARGIDPTIKYIDPSYQIRSLPANAYDRSFCLVLGQMAVHAGLAGKTDLVVGYHHRHFTHVPISLVTRTRKRLIPEGDDWQRVLQSTGQPDVLTAR